MTQYLSNESTRLEALHSLGVLDTPPEPEFDGLVQAAALVCDVPISLISLIDSDRQWFKANVGLESVAQTPREVAFCNHTISKDGLLEIGDATKDARFCTNPLVTGEPDIRFYAGVTLRLSDGSHVGSLCVIDRVARELTEKQRSILQHLSRAAVIALEARKSSNYLAVSQARFQALSESSPLGIFSSDASGAFTYINDQCQLILGLGPEEAHGHGWSRNLHPEDKESVFSEWQRTASLRLSFDMEYRVQHDSGTVRHVRAISRPILSKTGEISGHIGSVEDITERRQVQGKLVDEHRRFEAIIEGTNAGSWEWNIQTDELRRNARWAEIVGLEADVLGPSATQIWASRIHPDDTLESRAQMKRHLDGESAAYECEIRVRHSDGHWVWVVDRGRVLTYTADGKPEWMFGTILDVSERKKQEEMLRQSEALLKETGMLANVGGCELDVATGQLRWSDQYCRMHGLKPGYQPTAEEAINHYVPEDQPVIRQAVQNAMTTGEAWDLELRLRQISGDIIWVRIVGHGELVDGKPVRIRGAMQDITAQMKQRQALEGARERIAIATESGGIGIWEWNIQDGILNWTDRMFAIYGLPIGHSEVTYELWFNCVHPEDRASSAEAVQNAIEEGDLLDIEFRVVWPDSSVHHMRASAHITRDTQGVAVKMLGVNWDVTSMRQLSNDHASQAELLRVTLESIGDAVITTNAKGFVTWQNPMAEAMTGWTSDDAIGKPLTQVFNIVNEETRQKTINPVTTCLTQGKVVGLSNPTLLISRDGDEYGIEDSAAPILDRDGIQRGAVLVFHDVTEQRRLSHEMSYRATHDALTGLINRAEFETQLQKRLFESAESDCAHSLIFLDLDQFKLVNDACGHSAGDQLLKQIAKLLNSTVRSGDILARLGGDEFGIILLNCDNEQANRVAQNICSQMDEFRFIHDERLFRVGASIGLVPLDNQWPDTAAAMQAADVSCYAAKEAGRNRVHTWFDTDKVMRQHQGEMQWATRLEEALDENRFELYQQQIKPLCSESTGMHLEILIRLRERNGSLIMPNAFLPAAERFHLATRIDRWVLEEAIEGMMPSLENSNVELVCINLSGQSIGDRVFHRDAIEILKRAGNIICQRLCLEITETAAVTNMADATVFIAKVRALGVRIALDDFGAGASSFGYLRTLKVDYLKIDGQFIKNLLDEPLNQVAVNCFVDAARVMGIETIAEYVDNPESLKQVREIGINYAQGFLLHQPEPLVCDQQECVSQPIYYRETESKNQPEKYVNEL